MEKLSDLARRMARVESLTRTQTAARSAREVGNVERVVEKLFMKDLATGNIYEVTVHNGSFTLTARR